MSAKRERWPAIPRSIRGLAGPITVRTLKRVKSDDGESCWGVWEAGKRTIELERGAKPQHKWRTLYHEWGHAVLDDSGIACLLSCDGAESICEAFASARMQELRGELGIAP